MGYVKWPKIYIQLTYLYFSRFPMQKWAKLTWPIDHCAGMIFWSGGPSYMEYAIDLEMMNWLGNEGSQEDRRLGIRVGFGGKKNWCVGILEKISYFFPVPRPCP